MQYKIFDDHKKGYSHIKTGAECEDYSSSYKDPDGRFIICVTCDGHSDRNCFRSARGAAFGCEAAVTILKRFFELYNEASEEKRKCGAEEGLRLKQAVRQYWDDLVFADLEKDPVSKEELEPLKERVRTIYETGKGLLNIYGTTLIAVGVTEGLCVALQIGDGIMLFADADGNYFDPLPYDAKNDTPSPTSLCDADLFTRENAFRCEFFDKLPCAAIVSSDGIADCMDQIEFMEFFRSLAVKLGALEEEEPKEGLNEAQTRFLESCTSFYADKGNGVEDDCSLAGFYSLEKEMPIVVIPREKAEKLLEEAIEERGRIEQDYGKRKQDMTEALNELEESCNEESGDEVLEKIKNTREILQNVVSNMDSKIAAIDSRIKIFEEYVKRSSGEINNEWTETK